MIDTVTQWTAPVMACVQPTGSTWTFDTYVPPAAPTAQVVVGPTGAAGPACSTGTGTCNMTVPIVLPANPTTALQAATKQYVDSATAPLLPANGVTTTPGGGLQASTVVAGAATVSGPLSQTVTNPPAIPTGSLSFYGMYHALTFNGPEFVQSVCTSTWCSEGKGISKSSVVVTSPGWNRGSFSGFTTPPQGGWSERGIHYSTITNYGTGQLIDYAFKTQAGVGDFQGIYDVMWDYGEGLAPTDEGFSYFGSQGGESPTANAASVALGGFGTVSLSVTCPSTNDCNFGGSRYLLDLSQPVAAGYATGYASSQHFFGSSTAILPGATAETPEQYTAVITSGTVTPSVAWGTLVSDLLTPISDPVGTGTTAEVATVTMAGGSGSAVTTSTLACFAGTFHEQAYPASVSWNSGTSTLTATFNLRQPHEHGSYVYFGGMCGDYVVFTANISDGLRYPVDVLGAIDATHLVTRAFAFGQNPSLVPSSYGNTLFMATGATGLSRSGSTVAMHIGLWSGNLPYYNGASKLFISGDATGKFNGLCTAATYATATSTLTCTQAGTSGDTSTAATIAVGDNAYGNVDFTIYPGAEVLSSDNLQQNILASPSVRTGNLNVEPNNTTWGIGDSVEEEHATVRAYHTQNLSLSVHNPGQVGTANALLEGIKLNWGGSGITGNGYGPNHGSGNNAMNISNGAPVTNYQYYGGVQPPPNGFSFIGPVGQLIGNSPAYGSYGLYYSAPFTATVGGVTVGGVNDPNFFYSPLVMTGAAGLDTFTYTPFNDTLKLVMNSASGGCTFTFAPTGYSNSGSGCISSPYITDQSSPQSIAGGSNANGTVYTSWSAYAPLPEWDQWVPTSTGYWWETGWAADTGGGFSIMQNAAPTSNKAPYQVVSRRTWSFYNNVTNTANNYDVTLKAQNESSSSTKTFCLGNCTLAATSQLPLVGTATTTASASDSVAVPGLTSSGHCGAPAATNATAAGLTGVYIGVAGSGTVTLYHSATAGGTFNVICTPN